MLQTLAEPSQPDGIRFPLKILYHHRTLGDGAEGIHVASMVQALGELGHEVRVAAVIGDKTNITTPRTRLLKWLTRWTPRPVYEVMELAYSLIGFRMLMSQIKAWKPDILYERYTLFNFAGLAAARKAGIPLVMEVNAPLAYERAAYEQLSMKKWARYTEGLICSHADMVVVVSSPLKKYLVEEGVIDERIIILPNGVDPNLFKSDGASRREIRERYRISEKTVVIGFVGILRQWHGLDLLLAAVPQIISQGHPIHVLLVGDGPSRTQLEELARSKGVDRYVTITGRVPHTEIPQYISSFDIGVSPRATYYASPMKILEYMATGVAVVAPRMQNVQDLIRENDTGMLFEPENANDLARVLSLVVQNTQERYQLGQRALADVLERRTWRHNAARVIELLAGHRI